MQFFPVYLPAVRANDVHIKQASQPGGILDVRGKFLDGQRVGVQHIESFAASGLPDDILMERGELRPEKLLPQQPTTPLKAPSNERRILHRAADIHGKADKGLVVLSQQSLLMLYPALPGIQHLEQ